jgi:peptidoglycan hydrolase-like protein with peptidoglycan-binding domain
MDRVDDDGVSGAQGRLLNLGYPVGPIDGKLGPRTRAALRQFQTDMKLQPVSGELDDQTKKALVKAHGY